MSVVSFVASARAQEITQRGFIEGVAVGFAQEAPDDATRAIAQLHAREEVFARLSSWLQVAGGIDVQNDTHSQTEDDWHLDFTDRTTRRPRLSVRRLSATVSRGPATIDIGKQFVRWGKTDIVTPTDRFAPRDFLNVVEPEFLPIAALRAATRIGDSGSSLEGVWSRFTPSRIPLLDQRWTVKSAPTIGALVDAGADLPERSQFGVRWSHVGDAVEYSASYFDGFNHLPLVQPEFQPVSGRIDVRRTYPHIRTIGGDVAVPTRWLTVKSEAAYFASSSDAADEYVLYVVQLERQTGEWVLVGGYAGEAVTRRGTAPTFSPDRGLSRALVGRASYTIDVNRSVAFETAVRQNFGGLYAKAEYSQARGQHWRATATLVAIAGHGDDFLGQYHRNSHGMLTVRYSF